ncbi:hypothetical protein [Crocinitomix catalasitica]|uniref:hypothetical protein n=1 Tax=Crocinitomix catalasitica TaxID=184607 RepID=UPI0004855237|nr:hypothetical protein [Crocinitomix catalasitica]
MRFRFLKESNVLVFKTNIENDEKLNQLKPIFDNQQSILQWTVDIEDVDKVLRLETKASISEKKIIKLMSQIGINCKVMTW